MIDEHDDIEIEEEELEGEELEEEELEEEEIAVDRSSSPAVEIERVSPKDFESNFRRERRNSKRFDETLSARIEDKKCTVLNISNKGVLLQTGIPVYFFPLSSTLEFELQVEGEWLLIKGRVMWIQSDVTHSKIGLFIHQAPEPYFNFLKKLYE
jgi:hypothetical protein